MRLAFLLLASLVLDWLRPATPIFERPRMKNPDTYYGLAATVAGSAGLTLQVMTDWLNLGAVALNILLALGGLYLLWLRIRKAKQS